MNKILLTATLCLSLSLNLSACDSPSPLVTNTGRAPINLRVNLTPATFQQAGQVQILDPGKLPEGLRNAESLEVIFDSSRSTVSAVKQADGSFIFPLNTNRSFNSNNELSVLLVGDNRTTLPVLLQAGNLATLAANPITVSPSQNITLGTRVNLKANVQEEGTYRFSWQAGPTAAGPFESLTGSGESIEWQPQRPGSYYIQLTLTDTNTQDTSEYVSPVPQVYVEAPDNIVQTEPVSGSIIAGDSVRLTMNLPEYRDTPEKTDFQWFYGTSPQAPFQPIGATGRSIVWEPPMAGSYFIRLQTRENGRLSTYTTAATEVLVATASDVISTRPANGTVIRGESIGLSAAAPNATANSTYTWFYGFSPQGPFQAIAETGASIEWTPPLTGEFFMRVRVFNPETEESRVYTSDQTLVSARDSNQTFTVQPADGNVKKGETVTLTLTAANTSDQVNWSFGNDLQQPFNPISASGKTITWTPETPGRFYLRASVTRSDGTVANFSSADPLVFVADQTDVIEVRNRKVRYQLGESVTLNSKISRPGLRYSWAYSTSAQGPFQPVQTLNNNQQKQVEWFPPQVGSYFVQLTVIDNDSQLSFVSTSPLVSVAETTPLFSTNPANGRIEATDNVRLFSTFRGSSRSFNYGWAYSSSTAGPFTPLGGSTLPEFLWDQTPKPTGSFFIRLQAIAPGSANRITFISSTPVVFVNKNDNPTNEFGTP